MGQTDLLTTVLMRVQMRIDSSNSTAKILSIITITLKQKQLFSYESITCNNIASFDDWRQ